MSADGRASELSRLLEGTRISRLTLSTPTETITLRRDVGPAAPPVVPVRTIEVTAPCAGVFLPGHPLRERPSVQPGESVQAGETLGLVRVGLLLVHVTAPCAGQVEPCLVAAGAVVGYGTVLMRLAAE